MQFYFIAQPLIDLKRFNAHQSTLNINKIIKELIENTYCIIESFILKTYPNSDNKIRPLRPWLLILFMLNSLEYEF